MIIIDWYGMTYIGNRMQPLWCQSQTYTLIHRTLDRWARVTVMTNTKLSAPVFLTSLLINCKQCTYHEHVYWKGSNSVCTMTIFTDKGKTVYVPWRHWWFILRFILRVFNELLDKYGRLKTIWALSITCLPNTCSSL